jgi:trk system potassium uptake protein TrkH
VTPARARGTRWGGRLLGVDLAAALGLVGGLLKYLGLTFLYPLAIALGYGESPWPFLIGGIVTSAAGTALQAASRGAAERAGAREGFLVITLLWLLAPAFGALPYVLSGEDQFSRPLNAYFEAMSGFTTTSSSILTDVESLNHSLAMWRQFTVWLGGIGIIVLALAVLPRLRVGGRQLLEAEMPGPDVGGLTATIRDTARRFLFLYIALTAGEVASLTFVAVTGLDDQMSFYEAVAHTFTTLGTGGFSTQARSFEAFGPWSQWVVAFFLVAAGTNYALMYRAIRRRRPGAFARDEEFRLYLAVLTLASALLLVELWTEGIATGEEAVRLAVFQTTSIMTTTGFASADFNEWTALTSVTLVGLMFFGASAGSTSGSIKVIRHVLIGRILRRELVQTVHPELVSHVRFNGRRVEGRTLRAVESFVLLYVGVFALGTLVLIAEGSRTGLDLGLLEAVGAAATTLGNVGPAFGFAGPMGSFEPFSDVSKAVMILLMLVGRLEIIPVAVLLTRSYWRV